MDKVQQVIVMRIKYPAGEGKTKKLRTGKLIAQGSHASVAFLTDKIRNTWDKQGYRVAWTDGSQMGRVDLSEEEVIWIEDKFTKICVYVETEEELLAIYEEAKEAGLTSHLIQDCGDTEFNGVPTITAVGIGPHYKSKLDPITGHLPLF